MLIIPIRNCAILGHYEQFGGCGVNWFHEIVQNPYVDVALLVDGTGHLVATSNRIGSAAQRVASMIKAAEVLASGLSAELGGGRIHTLQLSTHDGHLLVMPAGISHYLIVLTGKDAPLELIFSYMQRVLTEMQNDDLRQALSPPEPDDWDVEALIESVTDWLHAGGDNPSFYK